MKTRTIAYILMIIVVGIGVIFYWDRISGTPSDEEMELDTPYLKGYALTASPIQTNERLNQLFQTNASTYSFVDSGSAFIDYNIVSVYVHPQSDTAFFDIAIAPYGDNGTMLELYKLEKKGAGFIPYVKGRKVQTNDTLFHLLEHFIVDSLK